MNATGTSPSSSVTAEESPVRRVRDEVKDGLAVIAVSVLVSSALAALLVVVTGLAS